MVPGQSAWAWGTYRLVQERAPRSGTDTGSVLGDWEKVHWNEGIGECEQNMLPSCYLRGKNKASKEA